MIIDPPIIGAFAKQRIDQLVQMYEEAEKRINKALTKAALTDYQKFRLNEFLRQVKGIRKALDKEIPSLTADATKESYLAGADFAADAMNKQGMSVPPPNMGNKIHTSALQAVTDQMTHDLLTANGSLELQAARILRKTQQSAVEERQINTMIGRGVVEGETRRQVSKRLTQAIKDEIGEGVKLKINGRNFDPASYAECVARTRTREAVTTGTKTFARKYDVVLFQVAVHENACSYCQEFHGKVFSVVEGTGFPLLEEEPPYHPRCECGLVPYVPVEEGDAEYRALKKLSNSKTTLAGQEEYDAYIGEARFLIARA